MSTDDVVTTWPQLLAYTFAGAAGTVIVLASRSLKEGAEEARDIMAGLPAAYSGVAYLMSFSGAITSAAA